MSRTIIIKADLSPPATRLSAHVSLAAVCSFEMFFLLFLMAGLYKADPRFQWIAERFSLDLTALFLLFSGAAAAAVLLQKGYRIPNGAAIFVMAATALFGYMILSLLWTPGDGYAHTKALHIGVLTAWTTVAAAMVIASERLRVQRFLFYCVLFAAWLSLESLSARARDGGGSVEALGVHYLGLGRAIGPAALVALGYGLFWTKNLLQQTVALTVAAIFIFVLLILGGRMPLLATIAGGLVPLALAVNTARTAHRSRAMWTYLVLLTAAAAVVVYLGCSEQTPQTLRRMTGLLQSQWGNSSYTRWQYYHAALEYWRQRPLLGHGIGAWPLLHLQGDFRAYPHNLILEIMVEFGLVGLGLFVWLLIAAGRTLGTLRQIAADPLRVIVLMMVVNAMANAMTSGDIPDNRFLFAALGLMLLPRMQYGRVLLRE